MASLEGEIHRKQRIYSQSFRAAARRRPKELVGVTRGVAISLVPRPHSITNLYLGHGNETGIHMRRAHRVL
jgi:hypothetical protein